MLCKLNIPSFSLRFVALTIYLAVAFCASSISLYAQDIEDRFHVLRAPFSERENDLTSYEQRSLRGAMERRSDIEFCGSGALSDQGLTLNWSQLRRHSDIVICVFLAAEEAKNPESFTQWMQRQGFDAILHSYTSDLTTGERAPAIYAYCQMVSDCPIMVYSPRYLVARLLGRPIQVAILYGPNSQPISTTLSISWN